MWHAIVRASELSSDEVKAHMLFDRRLYKFLFDDHQAQDPQSDRDAVNAQVEVSNPSADDSNTCEQSQTEECNTRVEEPFENQVLDLEDSIIDETLELST
jgi:hypothetical protein